MILRSSAAPFFVNYEGTFSSICPTVDVAMTLEWLSSKMGECYIDYSTGLGSDNLDHFVHPTAKIIKSECDNGNDLSYY